MNKYQKQKEAARQQAIEWQLENCERNMYMSELAEVGEYFARLGRRFGLLREFRENAIPC